MALWHQVIFFMRRLAALKIKVELALPEKEKLVEDNFFPCVKDELAKAVTLYTYVESSLI